MKPMNKLLVYTKVGLLRKFIDKIQKTKLLMENCTSNILLCPDIGKTQRIKTIYLRVMRLFEKLILKYILPKIENEHDFSYLVSTYDIRRSVRYSIRYFAGMLSQIRYDTLFDFIVYEEKYFHKERYRITSIELSTIMLIATVIFFLFLLCQKTEYLKRTIYNDYLKSFNIKIDQELKVFTLDQLINYINNLNEQEIETIDTVISTREHYCIIGEDVEIKVPGLWVEETYYGFKESLIKNLLSEIANENYCFNF